MEIISIISFIIGYKLGGLFYDKLKECNNK